LRGLIFRKKAKKTTDLLVSRRKLLLKLSYMFLGSSTRVFFGFKVNTAFLCFLFEELDILSVWVVFFSATKKLQLRRQ